MLPAIEVNRISKQYRYSQSTPYLTLRDTISHVFRQKLSPGLTDKTFWALQDISFNVYPGQIYGIIGSNGAGKSTLLKILSRITWPTSGQACLRGRIASLLEVGTGFHQELTGRENIYLNGAILGMTRYEINRKFDSIVEFSEVEKFLDTPVKHYSSGMYMRLAFSIAAHLDSEILLIDEVLAVGDHSFQQKCLGLMQNITRSSGKTIVFVSHNLDAIRRLCSHSLLLSRGQIMRSGATEIVLKKYLSLTPVVSKKNSLSKLISLLPQDPVFSLRSVKISQNNIQTTYLQNGLPTEIAVNYSVKARVSGLRIYFEFTDSNSDLIFRSFQDIDSDNPAVFTPGQYVSKAFIPANFFAPGNYQLIIKCGIYNVRNIIPDGLIIPLTISHTGLVNRAYPKDVIKGKISPLISWETTICQ